MNAHAEIEDVSRIVETDPGAILMDDDLYARLLAQVKAEVSGFEPDLSTATSRKEIGSLAYRITRIKTAIDNAGKKLNEDARAKINAVDARRRVVRDDFDALVEEARKPLTDWETQEKARIEYCKSLLKAIEDCGNGFIGGEPQPFAILLNELETKIVINAELGEFEDQARVAHRIAIDKVRAAFDAHQKAEAQRIELEQLRAEKAQREAEEAARAEKDRLAKEAAERERLERERQVKAEAEYQANVARAAEEARQAEIAKAKAEQERVEREAAAKVAAAEAEAKAAREKASRDERERQEAIRREQAEREARERDREHRGKLMAAAKEAMMVQGAGEATAKKIVLAIIAGEIPHVRMEF